MSFTIIVFSSWFRSSCFNKSANDKLKQAGFSVFVVISSEYTRKNLVTSLQTSREQDVFARLVPSCQQVAPNLLTTCNKLDENIRLVTRLF